MFKFRHVFILSLAITIVPAPLICAEKYTEQDVKMFESLIEGWHALGNTLSQASQYVADLFQDIFYGSDYDTSKFKYDATLVGFVNFADGIGRHPILFKECLEKHVKLNFLSTRNIPIEAEDEQLGLPRLDPANKQDIGAVAILTDIIADKSLAIYKKVPNSLIKIAYTMFESTEIPCNWPTILNTKFDMAVVPDPFLCDVYKRCGVKIPIFVLPLPLVLQDFLKIRQRPTPHKQFVFGMTAGFWKRKNHLRVLEAFAVEFGNRQDVKLILHGRFGQKEVIRELRNKIAKYKLTNVELIVKPYNWEEYLEFFKSLDCYVFLSMGEGFSITPREALACGKPCILTNNTAHTTICNTETVRVVPSNILVPALYDNHYDNHNHYPNHCGLSLTKNFFDMSDQELLENTDDIDLFLKSATIGYQFDCTIHDARQAMRDVYEHYIDYVLKARRGREWVKKYLHKNLCKQYVSLIKPKCVVLGAENIIGDECLMTNSKALYEKYQYLIGE